MKLTRADLEALIQRYKERAQHAHQDMRHWQNRALDAETQLFYWKTQATIAEGRLRNMERKP